MRKDVLLKMFKNKVKFVKPLYKKAKENYREKAKILAINFDSSIDLHGDGIVVNRNVNTKSDTRHPNIIKFNKNKSITLPGVCESGFVNITRSNFDDQIKNVYRDKCFDGNTVSIKEVTERKNSKMFDKEAERNLGEGSKEFEAKSKQIVLHKVSDAWLRVYPAPRKLGENLCSIVIRCVFCQLGLTAVLVIWNIIWVFIIHSFEGPEEVKVSLDFEKEQNQLVIDLATELRQITPLSPKWREAIEQRLDDARQLTMMAMGKGAKLKPGLFWDLPGTFLFSIYVMTALGFGAPVPYTVWGRMSALIYAILAVPTHIYLMWNASAFIVVSIEKCTDNLNRRYCKEWNAPSEKSVSKILRENAKCNENANKANNVHCNKFFCTIVIFCLGHSISLTMVIYYIVGVVVFGVVRNRMPLEIVMFPLEFTTTGGLENVQSHIRILYGFYVEGAMCLLACGLANIRRFSSSPVASLLENYRLFHDVNCTECESNEQRANLNVP